MELYITSCTFMIKIQMETLSDSYKVASQPITNQSSKNIDNQKTLSTSD